MMRRLASLSSSRACEGVHAAVRDEDFAMLPQCGQAVRHGQHDHMIIGRNEIGVQHMIRVFADELGVSLH
jgi:choline monooxygenase